MAIQVDFDGTRVNDSDSNTDWGNFNVGGGAPASEAQLVYQGASTVNKKITSTGLTGIDYDPGANAIDMTDAQYPLWFAKGYITDYADLNTTFGVEYAIGSANNAFYSYNVAGSSAENSVFTSYPARGGYNIVAINPTLPAWRSSTGSATGTPSDSAIDYFAMGGAFQTGAAKNENLALDAIDIGRGLYMYDDGGSPTSPSATGKFDDFVTFDQNDINNRWGVVNGSDTVFECRGLLTIGDLASPPNTLLFSDSERTITFVDGYHGPGDVGVKVLLNATGNDVTVGSTLIGAGVAGDDTVSPVIPDTRPDFTVEGTTGTFLFDNATLTNFRLITFTSACTTDGGTLEAKEITQASSDIENATIRTTSAANVATIDDPVFGTTTDLNNTDFVQAGLGHAIEIDTAGSYTFTNIGFSGYSGRLGSNPTGGTGSSAAAILNSSGGEVTINVVGGDTPSVRNAAGSPESTTVVVAAASFDVTNLVAGSEVRFIIEGASPVELAGVESIGLSPEGLNGVTTAVDPDNAGRYKLTYSYDQADAPISVTVRVVHVDYIIFSQALTLTAAGGSYISNQREDRNYSNP